jgi:transposase
MNFVGIDVAKTFHMVSIVDENETRIINKAFRIENTMDGFEKLLRVLDSISLNKDNFTLGLEATGIYGENLLEFLKSKGYNIKLLNPALTVGRKYPRGANLKI